MTWRDEDGYDADVDLICGGLVKALEALCVMHGRQHVVPLAAAQAELEALLARDRVA